MDLSWRHMDAYFCLLFGGALAIWAIIGFVKHKSAARLGMLVWLSIAVAFMAVGLAGLMEFLAPTWLDVSRNAVSGIFLMMVGVNWLFTRPSERAASWLFIVVGTGCILQAVYSGLTTLWS